MARRSVVLGFTVVAALSSVSPAVAANKTTTRAKTTTTKKSVTYDTPAKAGAMFAKVDGNGQAAAYTSMMKVFQSFCTESTAKLTDMISAVILIHKENTGRTIKAGTVLVDLANAIKADPRRQACVNLLGTLGVMYDQGLDTPN